MSSCWTSERQVRTKAVVPILLFRLVELAITSSKLPSSFCWPCIHVRADLSNPGSEYLCKVMDDRAWTVNAVNLLEIWNWIYCEFANYRVMYYLRSEDPSASWKDPSGRRKLKIFCKMPFQLASCFARLFLVYWSWWKRSRTAVRLEGSADPISLHTSSKLEAIPPERVCNIYIISIWNVLIYLSRWFPPVLLWLDRLASARRGSSSSGRQRRQCPKLWRILGNPSSLRSQCIGKECRRLGAESMPAGGLRCAILCRRRAANGCDPSLLAT